MLNHYLVMQSTVTILFLCRLLGVDQLKQNIMRTLNNNQISSKSTESKSYTWNSKRRFR